MDLVAVANMIADASGHGDDDDDDKRKMLLFLLECLSQLRIIFQVLLMFTGTWDFLKTNIVVWTSSILSVVTSTA
jgi:hypothetical protein